MNYFFNITKEEKENILDKHKTLYDGYAVNAQQPSNMTPLYTQDYANDKGGITVNSKGEVSQYNNKLYMKESKNICNECGLYEEVCECGDNYMNESECSECGGMMSEGECSECGNKEVKGIGDKFDYTEEECDECGMNEEDFDSDLLYNESVSPKIHNQLSESLDMFKRFQK
jgi:hypothetical protein